MQELKQRLKNGLADILESMARALRGGGGPVEPKRGGGGPVEPK